MSCGCITITGGKQKKLMSSMLQLLLISCSSEHILYVAVHTRKIVYTLDSIQNTLAVKCFNVIQKLLK